MLKPKSKAKMFFNDIKNTIRTIPTEFPVFIYFGVGTAAGLLNAEQKLDDANYHQYPPFVQNLHNNFPTMRVILALIDPQQENPPYVAVHQHMQPSNNPDHYTNQDSTLQVFVWRQDIYTAPYASDVSTNPAAYCDITSELRALNQFAIEHRVSLLYHDFTGKPVRLLAEYFENDFPHHLDQVIYGMSAREDHGCYFDLTQPNAFFPIRLEGNLPVSAAPLIIRRLRQEAQANANNNDRPLLKMFNYYRSIVNNTLEKIPLEIAEYPFYMSETLISVQRDQIINEYKRQFKQTLLTLLRQIRFVLIHPDNEEKTRELQHNYVLREIPFFQRQLFIELLQAKEYQLLYDLLFDYTAAQLNIIAQIMGIDFTGEEMLKGITCDEDPYKWYNNIKLFL